MPLRTKLMVQDPPDASSVSTNPYHTIVFKHPGYQDDNNRLLTLPAYDDPKGGFDLETAKTICGILAGNRWDGFFTQDLNGPPVHVLEASGEYYFILPDASGGRDTTYPVVPAFSEWKFPHNDLPPSWPRVVPYLPSTTNSNITTALGLRDAFKCQISACEEGYEKAHLVPVKYSAWFHANDLVRYIFNSSWAGPRAVDDIHNMILLRADLHKAFDDIKFVFIPKKETPSESKSKITYVLHILSHSTELAKLYHNVELQASEKLVPQFLLARLALSIFPMFEGFLLKPRISRKILTQDGGIHEANPGECQSYISQVGARSRPASPEKAGSAASSPKRRRLDDLQEEEDHYTSSDHKNKRARILIPTDEEVILNPACGPNKAHSNALPTPYSQYQCESSEQEEQTPNALLDLMNLPALSQSDTFFQSENDDEANTFSDTINSSDTPAENPLDLKDEDRYFTIRTAALAAERERSDRDGIYKKELEWAQKESMRKECDPASIRKLYEICGYEMVGD